MYVFVWLNKIRWANITLLLLDCSRHLLNVHNSFCLFCSIQYFHISFFSSKIYVVSLLQRLSYLPIFYAADNSSIAWRVEWAWHVTMKYKIKSGHIKCVSNALYSLTYSNEKTVCIVFVYFCFIQTVELTWHS